MTARIASKKVRVAFFGAAPDTPNMGVSALFQCVVEGLASCLENLEIVVFDNGTGLRRTDYMSGGGYTVPLLRCGIRAGRRFYRGDNLLTVVLAGKFARLGPRLNQVIRLIDSCTAVIDASGGDSFSDIYGRKRFDAVARPKRIARARGKPLILLPQTYGPYLSATVRKQARAIVRDTHQAWARDRESYGLLTDLLGDSFDEDKHRSGVDMAFLLKPANCSDKLSETVRGWLDALSRENPVVGINVSGLIYNDPGKAERQYGFRSDYRRLVGELVAEILRSSDARIILVPHVMSPPGHYESDYEAALTVRKTLAPDERTRVEVIPPGLTAAESKWLLGRLDWLCATRMHAAIGGLSSGVPTAALSYSDKTRGVFETCGQIDNVVDPRVLYEDEAGQRLLASFARRAMTRAELADAVPRVQERAQAQMETIAAEIRAIVERVEPAIGRSPEPFSNPAGAKAGGVLPPET